MPNITIEDYIKAIYKLEVDGGRVTTSALATHLQLSDASITDMMKKLSTKGLVHYERYQGVGLAPKGKRMALKIVRRHRLWEMYLVKFLGFSWDRVHDEAERLEHITSDEMEARLDQALGSPSVDPHGDPIPGIDGDLAHPEYVPLTKYVAGDVVRVLRVSDSDPQILQHATTLGVGLHKKLTVKEKKGFDGSMVVRVAGRDHFMSKEVARSIFVEPA